MYGSVTVLHLLANYEGYPIISAEKSMNPRMSAYFTETKHIRAYAYINAIFHDLIHIC